LHTITGVSPTVASVSIRVIPTVNRDALSSLCDPPPQEVRPGSRAVARKRVRCGFLFRRRHTLTDIYPQDETIIGERESAADGGTSCAAEESPPTGQTRSRTQVRVARVTAMTQKRHGPPSVMKRSSPHTAGERRGFIPAQLVERSGGKR